MSPIEQMRQYGRFGDSMLAHINPREAMMLEMMGGSGTINPMTGLPEFWDGDGDGDGMGGDGMGGMSAGMGGPGESGMSSGMGDGMSNGGDSFGFGGPADQGVGEDSGLSAEQQSNLDAILSDMNETAETNITVGRGFTPGNYGGYLNAVGTNIGKGLESSKFSTIGTLLGMLSPIPMGSLIGRKIGQYADAYGFSSPGASDMTGENTGFGGGNMQEGSYSVASSEQSPSQPMASAPMVQSPDYSFLSGQMMEAWKKEQESMARRGMNPGSPQFSAAKDQWRDWYDQAMGQIRS